MRGEYTPEQVMRFASKVLVTEDCWYWTAGTFENGYGLFCAEAGIPRGAHRVMWEMVNGPIPDGLLVRHTCDQRNCVNPDHLLLGTQRDNHADAIARGRHASQALWKGGEAARNERKRQARRVQGLKGMCAGEHWRARHPAAGQARGERQGAAKLTADAVRTIRQRHAAGESQGALGRAFGVSRGAIQHIVYRDSWQHVD